MHPLEIGAAAHVLAAIARLWAVAGDLFTAGAILWALDTLARVVRATYAAAVATYQAGRLCGQIWRRDLLPLLLLTLKACRAVWRRIHWPTVARVAVAVVVFSVASLIFARRLVITASAALGARFAAWITRNDPKPTVALLLPPVAPLPAPVPPVVAVAAVTPLPAAVEPLPRTVAALHSLARRRGFSNQQVRSARKAQLIELLAPAC